MLAEPVPLTSEHILTGFASGVGSPDDWLLHRALRNEAAGASRTFVVADPEGRVLAYYALAAGALKASEAVGSLRRNMPDPIPMAMLGRLALDKSLQGKRFGGGLLDHAISNVRHAGRHIGIRGVLVQAISDKAAAFYARYGFKPGPNEPFILSFTLLR